MMKTSSFPRILLLVLASCLGVTPLSATGIRIPSNAGQGTDAFVNSYHEADANFQHEPRLRLRRDPNNQADRPHRKIYLRFDLAGKPADVGEARLELVLREAFSFGSNFQVRLYALDEGLPADSAAGWSRGGITWNNAPANAVGDPASMASGATLLGTAGFSGSPAAGSVLRLDAASMGATGAAALSQRIRDDTNGLLTLMLVPLSANASSLEFVSGSTAEATAPTLVISPPVAVGLDARFASFAAHPRLLLTPTVADRIRGLRDSDPLMAALLQSVKVHADLALTQPLPGGDMKEKRRHSMFRVFNLGLMYRLDGNAAYANRIRDYLLDAVTWKDWGGQWLNTGEMAAWTALGYDWIYDHLSPADRDKIRDGIVNIAINRGLSAHAAGNEHWLKSADNWNQVCNGGLVLAALATAEHEVPGARQQETNDKAETTVANALRSYGFVLPAYAPDGDWFEGPTYYAYGATYQALALQALQDAYGDLRGLDSLAGFDAFGRSGEHFIQAVGPTGLYFNHGDAKPRCYFTPLMFWLARHAQRPDFATWERRQLTRDLGRMSQTAPILMMAEDTLDRFHALSALWYVPAEGTGEESTPPKAQHFRGLAAAGAMRSGWALDSVYLGFKGGFPDADHAHMDCGSFVLDAGGVRWAMDFGADDGSVLPNYYDSKRWNYYRTHNQGHNTLVINGARQKASGKATVTDFRAIPGGHRAIVNLSNVYDNANAVRGFLLLDDGRVIIEDRITPPPGLPVRWGMATPAAITLVSPGIAMLSQEGLFLRARVLAPEGADFQILSTNPYELNPSAPANQNTNPGTRMLGIVTPSPAVGELEITVLLERVEDDLAEPAPPPLPRPVRDWRRDAPEDALNRSLFRAWKEEHLAYVPGGVDGPLGADAADPDEDHADNFTEYAFIGDPRVADPAILPRIDPGVGTPLLRVRRWAGGLVEADGSYRARGIRYAVEHNESLPGNRWSPWTDAWNQVADTDANGEGGETVWIALADEEDSQQTQAYRVSVFNHSPSVE